MNQYQLVPNRRVAQQQTVDYFRSVQGPLRAINDGVLGKSASSLGQAVVKTTPIATATRLWNKGRVVQAAAGRRGIGQTDATAGMGMLALVAITYVVVTGALSYQAGKAMSPNAKGRTTWGWVGVPVGVLTGPWGLGVMGIVSNSRKG